MNTINKNLTIPDREPDAKCTSLVNEEQFWFEEMVSCEFFNDDFTIVKKLRVDGDSVFVDESTDEQAYLADCEYADAVLWLYNNYVAESILLGED